MLNSIFLIGHAAKVTWIIEIFCFFVHCDAHLVWYAIN